MAELFNDLGCPSFVYIDFLLSGEFSAASASNRCDIYVAIQYWVGEGVTNSFLSVVEVSCNWESSRVSTYFFSSLQVCYVCIYLFLVWNNRETVMYNSLAPGLWGLSPELEF